MLLFGTRATYGTVKFYYKIVWSGLGWLRIGVSSVGCTVGNKTLTVYKRDGRREFHNFCGVGGSNVSGQHKLWFVPDRLPNPLNAELNPICYLLALLGAHNFLHVSRIRVKSLTLRQLMSYIYRAPILDVSRSHTTTHHSR